MEARKDHTAAASVAGRDEDKGGMEGCCLLLEMLPQELLCAIFSFVVGEGGGAATRDLKAWCLTCSTFNALADDETRHRCRCFAAWPVLFDLALSPVFGAPIRPLSPALAARRAEQAQQAAGRRGLVAAEGEEASPRESRAPPSPPAAAAVKLSWKLRAQLLSHLPSRLTGKTNWYGRHEEYNLAADTIIDAETGRKHTNQQGGNCSLLADQPFVSTNRKALADALAASVGDVAASDEWLDEVLFRGVEYFEMTVVHNTQSYNRAAAIGISQFFNHISFLGWNNTSIAYHSDDGIIHGGLRRSQSPFVGTTFQTFESGDVVGCGVDWDAGDVFFTRVRAKAVDVSTDPDVREDMTSVLVASSYELNWTAWYPAIASMMKDDVLRVNFGHEPFVFDVKSFIEEKHSDPSSTATSSDLFSRQTAS